MGTPAETNLQDRHVFLLQFTEGNPEDHDREVDRVEWFPIDDAIDHASYKQEKDILRKAKRLISGDKRPS